MAIHTIQLVSKPLKKQQFRHCMDRAFELIQKSCYRIAHKDCCILAVQPSGIHGIKIVINNAKLPPLYDSTIPHLSLTFNPSLLLGGGYDDLCDITPSNFEFCAAFIDNILDELETGLTCDKLILSRIDCTLDVDFPCETDLMYYIMGIKRTALPAYYKQLAFGPKFENYKERNRHSFRAACQDVTLTVYDKSFQLLEQELMAESEVPSNRLRFEVAIQNQAFQRLLNKYGPEYHLCTCYDRLDKKIIWFSKMSVHLVRDYFKQTLTPGEFLSGRLAVRKIVASDYSDKTKRRMVDFLCAVGRYHKNGIAGAIRAFKEQGYSQDQVIYLLRCFQKIDLNPVTVNVNSGFDRFPSISELLAENALPASIP